MCSGGAFVAGDGVIFADINGSGRDHYLSIDENGAVEACINGDWDTSVKKWI